VHREQTDGYQTLIRLSVGTERGERSVAGTLVHEQQPRVVEINRIEIEAQLGAHMLYLRNLDKPGFIGALGQALGDAGINIATFHLGRAKPGGNAIALIEVDQPVPDEVLRTICALPHTRQCKPLSF
jgi:D-3-phosphoglycerate dehydrogenase